MIKDPLLANQRNLSRHEIQITGVFPKKTVTAVFHYADGCSRTYDGREWKVIASSDEVLEARQAEVNHRLSM